MQWSLITSTPRSDKLHPTTMSNLDKYQELYQKELKLREEVIRTQSESVEAERIQVALERERLLFDVLTDEEIAILRKE